MIKEERKKEQKRIRRRKRFLISIVVLIVLFGSAFLIAWNGFKINEVVVEGNVLYPDEAIEETILNDDFSWNALYVFFKYKFTKTKDIPFVSSVEVSLKDRNTVCLKVYEKGLMGYLANPETGENIYFDKDGVVSEISARTIEGVPLISGLTVTEIELYQKLDINDTQLMEMLLLTQSLKRAELTPDYIIYGNENSPIVAYGQVWVYFGDISQISAKIERLAQILPQVIDRAGVLHLETWTESSTNIVFDPDFDEEE